MIQFKFYIFSFHHNIFPKKIIFIIQFVIIRAPFFCLNSKMNNKSAVRKSTLPSFPSATDIVIKDMFRTHESLQSEEYMMSILRCHCGYSPRTRFSRNFDPGQRLYFCGSRAEQKCDYLVYHWQVRSTKIWITFLSL